MHILRRWIRHLFGFSRRETNGFLILGPLIMAIIFSEPLYEALTREGPKDFTEESVMLDSMLAILKNERYDEQDTIAAISLFPFNPNTVSRDQLLALGFTDELSNRMITYRGKGGRFIVKADLLKIYGMDSTRYEKVLPFIELPVVRAFDRAERRVQQAKQTPNNADSLFDINMADSMQLIKINGIGPVLSSRIIRYRSKLGGFISKSQLYEVYGLDSIVVDRLASASFVDKKFVPRKLNINLQSEIDLSAHPYLSRPEAKAIVAYRFQHGSFLTVGDIRKIHSISEKTFYRIEPYLAVE
ncbi:MAG TPA: helix-hairpin-helix domain-containing protein [Cyclobacteriaceae bacterium]|nr:helix-hairpin-helix domain-containing protein [Cyclobacteriaceae bacterium]